jgi:hypothetical protein
MSLAVRTQRKDDYIPSTMTTNNADWERGWFYLRNAEPGLPPYTGKVLRDRPPSWYHGVSPPQHQTRLDSLVAVLKELAGRGLIAGVVLANLHHRRAVPLMERPLRIYEMTEIADPVALAKSRLLRDPFPRGTRPPGRGAPSIPSQGAATTRPCGSLRCCPPAHW